jgi:hypothetical protein
VGRAVVLEISEQSTQTVRLEPQTKVLLVAHQMRLVVMKKAAAEAAVLVEQAGTLQ